MNLGAFFYRGIKSDLNSCGEYGDVITVNGLEYVWDGTQWYYINSYTPPKIYRHPVNCKCCGAILTSTKCEYCGAEYFSEEIN